MGTYSFKLPDIGEGVVEAEITAWHVAPGETVEEDQPLADAMTDKATIELTSPVDGVVRTVACEEGETVAVGADLVVFDTDGGEATAPAGTESEPAAETPASTGSGTYEFKLPDIGEGVVEAEITAWHVAVGDAVEEDDPVADAMTDKATIELTSPVSGTVKSVAGDEGDTVAVGATLVSFAVEGGGNIEQSTPVERVKTAAPTSTPSVVAPVPVVTPSNRPLASPAVRKRAKDAGLDLSAAKPTGAQGNVTHADLDKLETALEPVEGETRIKVIGLRRKIAQSMAESKRTIAHFTYVDEVDVTALEALRKRANDKHKDERPKLTVLPFIIRALAATLKDWPQFNAHYQDGSDGRPGGFVSQFADINLGIATQTDIGLVVPVIQQAQTLTLWETAEEITRLANGARDNKLMPADFQGATTTLTSLGPLGGIVTTPVVNKPEVAIFGPNKIRPKLEMRNGEVVERLVMNFSVSCDHRVIDGYDAAQMVQHIKRRLQDPMEMFLA
ncbi:2-oxo acid dehydrogenase subunit E2 [uncultured Algimonas sp.]|uniref:2-oxo acid dehydrogenase subunit E2 n=1 Tax=uncultured Algimonas sp. TaxID=1547920 RepID=UPI0026024505|nr:2-oxo acid dehydrogenase subunit E2 [uncultured Algimonas sp.]